MMYKKSLKQKGFSLVELMVALLLGLFLSFGVVNVFITSKLNFSSDEEAIRMQENARYALRYLSREISMSSFFAGLVDSDMPATVSITTDCGGSNWATDLNRGTEVIDNWSSGALATSTGTTLTCISDLQTNSDVISVKRTADQPTAEDGVLVASSISDNQMYVRSEEYGETVGFEYVAASATSFSALASNVDYWKYLAKVFFIRDYSSTDGDAIPSLCVSSLTGNVMATDCIAEGVQSLQIEFGVDSDEDNVVDYYVPAPNATENQQLLSAKIFVLMRSVNTVPNYTDDRSYTLGQTQINGGNAFNDGFNRKIFSTTVKLRNPVTF